MLWLTIKKSVSKSVGGIRPSRGAHVARNTSRQLHHLPIVVAGKRPIERCGRNVGWRSLAIMTRPEIARLLKRARRLQDIGSEGEEVPQHQRKNDVSFEQEGTSSSVSAPDEGEQRCHSVAVLGAPNAGKSTLLNRMLGAKISIVSGKAQTTRNRVIGILTHGNTQTVFLDTPGVLPFGGPGIKKIPGELSRSSWVAAEEADSVVVVVDASDVGKLEQKVSFLFDEMQARELTGVLVLNKVDLVHPKERLLRLADDLFQRAAFTDCFMVSALHGKGITALEQALHDRAPPGMWQYPAEQVHTASKQDLLLELLREKVYQRLNQELPYVLGQEIESWRERKDGSIHIKARLLVHSRHQLKMVVGHRGEVVTAIREHAVRELEILTQRRIYLKLSVAICKDTHGHANSSIVPVGSSSYSLS